MSSKTEDDQVKDAPVGARVLCARTTVALKLIPRRLPHTFANSFHSADPRTALDQLQLKLSHGVRDNRAVISHIRSVASTHARLGKDLAAATPTDPEPYPTAGDDGASIGRALNALRDSAHLEAKVHRRLARELEQILPTFEQWAIAHEDRVLERRSDINGFLTRYESALKDLEKAKTSYEAKCEVADDAEDEARLTSTPPTFEVAPHGKPRVAPLNTSITSPIEKMLRSPQALMSAVDEKENREPVDDAEEDEASRMGVAGLMKRHGTIAERLRGALNRPPPADVDGLASKAIKGKESVNGSTPAMIEIGGVTNGAREWSSLLALAKSDITKRTVKVPLIATYNDAVNGVDLVAWIQEHVVGLDGSHDRAVEFCRQLVEDLSVLRVVGELGSRFTESEDSFYVFKPEAFTLQDLYSAESPYTRSPQKAASPRTSRPQSVDLQSSGLKRTSTLQGVGSYISSAAANVAQAFNEPKLHKAFREVDAAEAQYREAVARAETTRLALAERTALYLPSMQRSELERLRAVESVMRAFIAAQRALPAQIAQAYQLGEVAVDAVVPDQDLAQTIELYRTGSYIPKVHTFHSHYDTPHSATFGADLSSWASSKLADSPDVPELITLSLDRLQRSYADMASDKERRLAFVYEVPLALIHRVRTALINSMPSSRSIENVLMQTDGPVVAAVLKSWLLELASPVVPTQYYDDIRTLYPSIGARECSPESIRSVLEHVPRTNLLVLDAFIVHLAGVVKSTESADEDDDTFRTKLGLALGRCFVRPQSDTLTTLDDRAPAFFISDLIKHRDEILPPAIAHRSKRESDRFTPKRKRTALVDVRASRSRLGVSDSSTVNGREAQDVLEDQLHRRLGSPPRAAAETSTPIASTLAPPPVAKDPASSPEFVDARAELPSQDPSPLPQVKPLAPEDPPFEPPSSSEEEPSPAPVQQPLPTISAPSTAASTHEDPPFDIPPSPEHDEDKPLAPVTEFGHVERSGSGALQRSTGIRTGGTRGPRPMSGVGSGVRAIADRFEGRPGAAGSQSNPSSRFRAP